MPPKINVSEFLQNCAAAEKRLNTRGEMCEYRAGEVMEIKKNLAEIKMLLAFLISMDIEEEISDEERKEIEERMR